MSAPPASIVEQPRFLTPRLGRPMPSLMRLATYLNDHLAGATGGRELARRAAGSNQGNRYGKSLELIAREIDEDRSALLEVMAALDIGVDRLKVMAGWGAEKVGRLKPNGSLLRYSPLSRVVEIEGLILGVTGKLALWRSLERLSPEWPVLADFDLGALIARAESQLDELERHRLRAVDDAFS